MAEEAAPEVISAAKRPVKIVVSDKQRREIKQFSCDWHALRRSMQYFETVLDKVPESSTAPLTLNVNCDLVIFAWLMDYVNNFNPQLKVANVVSIILSSHFLKMGSLFKLALAFFKEHLTEVLTTDVNMSCVPPDVVAELESLLTIEELARSCLELQLADQDKCPNRLFLSQLVKSVSQMTVVPQRMPALRYCQFCGILYDAVKQQHYATIAGQVGGGVSAATGGGGAVTAVGGTAVLCPALSQGRIGSRGELMKSHDGTVVFSEPPPTGSPAECELWCWRLLGTVGLATCRRCAATVPWLLMRSHSCRGHASALRDFLPPGEGGDAQPPAATVGRPGPPRGSSSESSSSRSAAVSATNRGGGGASQSSSPTAAAAASAEIAEERLLMRFFFEYTFVPPLEPMRSDSTCDDQAELGGARVVWEASAVSSVFTGALGSFNPDMLRFYETKMFDGLQQLIDSLAPVNGSGGAGGFGAGGKAGRGSSNSGRAQTAAAGGSGTGGRNGSFRSAMSSAMLSSSSSSASSFGSVRNLAVLKKKPLFK
jgi:hypothetical protein